MKVSMCKTCDGHGSTNYTEWTSTDEDVEILHCEACEWNGFHITEPPKNLFEYFKFIHAYQSVSEGDMIPEYGIKRAFSIKHHTSMVDDLLGNFSGDWETDWDKTLDVFFGEGPKENWALYTEWDYGNDGKVQWYMEGNFDKPFAPSLGRIITPSLLSNTGLSL